MKQGDLFGGAMVQKRSQHYLKPRGYAFPPGTGPRGETCRTCQHKVTVHTDSNTFPKCELVRVNWTHSRRTDILVSSPACQYWKQR